MEYFWMRLLWLTVVSVESEVVIVHCLQSFVTFHNDARWLSWSNDGVNTVLQWMTTDSDDSQCQQVANSSVHTNSVCPTHLVIWRHPEFQKVHRCYSSRLLSLHFISYFLTLCTFVYIKMRWQMFFSVIKFSGIKPWTPPSHMSSHLFHNPFLHSSFTFLFTGLTPRTPAVFRFPWACRFYLWHCVLG